MASCPIVRPSDISKNRDIYTTWRSRVVVQCRRVPLASPVLLRAAIWLKNPLDKTADLCILTNTISKRKQRDPALPWAPSFVPRSRARRGIACSGRSAARPMCAKLQKPPAPFSTTSAAMSTVASTYDEEPIHTTPRFFPLTPVFVQKPPAVRKPCYPPPAAQRRANKSASIHPLSQNPTRNGAGASRRKSIRS